MPTTAEKLAAYVSAQKQLKREAAEKVEQANEARRAKEHALQAEREAQMAATAAAALKLGTYRMPPEEGGGALQRHHASSNGKRPQKVATERHLARRKHKDWQPNAVQVSNSAVTGGGGGKPRAADLMDDPATEL